MTYKSLLGVSCWVGSTPLWYPTSQNIGPWNWYLMRLSSLNYIDINNKCLYLVHVGRLDWYITQSSWWTRWTIDPCYCCAHHPKIRKVFEPYNILLLKFSLVHWPLKWCFHLASILSTHFQTSLCSFITPNKQIKPLHNPWQILIHVPPWCHDSRTHEDFIKLQNQGSFFFF